jgi:multidrug efflux pump subunit AcrB
LLFGVSKFLFSALALAFCLALLASFVVAMTVIPLFCSRFLKAVPGGHGTGMRRGRTGLPRIAPGAAVSMPGSIAIQ